MATSGVYLLLTLLRHFSVLLGLAHAILPPSSPFLTRSSLLCFPVCSQWYTAEQLGQMPSAERETLGCIKVEGKTRAELENIAPNLGGKVCSKRLHHK